MYNELFMSLCRVCQVSLFQRLCVHYTNTFCLNVHFLTKVLKINSAISILTVSSKNPDHQFQSVPVLVTITLQYMITEISYHNKLCLLCLMML